MKLQKTFIVLIILLILSLLLFACSGESVKTRDFNNQSDDDNSADDDADDDIDDDELPKPCADIYKQDILPTFEIEISQDNWNKLVYEYKHWQELQSQGKPIKNWYPLESFKYNDEVYHNVMIRLKGNPNWWTTPKMQFKISFNEIDKNQRFHGLRKLNLDAPPYEASFLRERLAFHFFRKLGIPASCANNARLVINGEYYGLYANIEHIDKEFLQRNFGNDDEGNLYKCDQKETNEEDPDTSDLQRFLSNPDIETLESIVNLEEAILEWAGEAVIPQLDGFFAGGCNFYLYNHPKQGFIFIPYDVDHSFEDSCYGFPPYNEYSVDPITFEVWWGMYGKKPPQFWTVLQDPYWHEKYIEAVETALLAYDPEELTSLIEQWSTQIAKAVEDDLNKGFSYSRHQQAVAKLRQFVVNRAFFVNTWLKCKRGEGIYKTETFGKYQYRFWATPCSWYNAQKYCKSIGGTLATPTTEAEQEFIVSKAFEHFSQNYWVGVNDIDSEGLWTDADSNLLYILFWAPNQPDGGEEQDCVIIDGSYEGKWNDTYCLQIHPAVCKITNE